MSDRKPMTAGYDLRNKTDEELCEWIGGWNDVKGAGYRVLGNHELQRRLRRPDAVRSWIAIGISLVAVVISITAHFCK
jgi:hypothetical protein